MAEGGAGASGLDHAALTALLPRLAHRLAAHHGDGAVHQPLTGTLLSADISGFTRLTEELASRGREGAEIITAAVNSCFADLIECGEYRGGDVIKFGGDAVLMLFQGPGHQARAAAAGQEMQFALRRNTYARRYDLLMTVGIADGDFHAMLVGTQQRDLLLCGEATTQTLVLEDGAEKGEVVASDSVRAAIGGTARAGGRVILDDRAWPSTDLAGHSANMAAFVPTELGRRWAEYADLGGDYRQAAIGFVMIAGVDEHLAEHGGPATAAALSSLIDGVHAALAPTATVLLHSDMAMDGVKLLVGAGVPTSIDDPADALLHAALQIARLDTPFSVRIGANIGTVFAGFLGARHRRTFTVMSDVVNTAARMLGPAGQGEVVAVNTVVERARATVEGVALEPFQVKGKVELISATKVDDLGAEGSADPDVDFIGRDTELERLHEAVTDGDAIDIVGPAGSGKTRLADEALEGSQLLGSAGGRYMTATPYGAFWPALRRVFGIDAGRSAREAGADLERVLAERHPAHAPYAALLAPTIGAELDENDTVAAIEPEFRRDVLHRVLVQVLREVEPAISAILVEDTQWLDEASRELLGHLQTDRAMHGWVVVQSSREPQAEESAGAAIRIELGPLADDAVARIIRQASSRRLLQNEIDRLVAQANGNPLFALELARSVGQPGEEIPGSIEEVVAARLDRLPARERSATRLASVIGARFEPSTFMALVEGSGYDIEVELASIEEIFEVDDDGFVRFRQLLYRDVAYASLPFARRKRLHLVVGEHLESTASDLGAVAALLSTHFHAAGDRSRCWTHSLQAAERAVRQNSPGDAITLYRRALDFAPRGIDKEERASAYAGFGQTLVAAGNLEEAYAAFVRARKLSADDELRARLLCDQADCRNQQGRFSDAMRGYASTLRSPGLTGEVEAAALVGRSSAMYRLSRNRESYDTAGQALAIAEAVGDRELAGRALQQMAAAGEAIDTPDHVDLLRRSLEIFTETDNLSQQAEVRNNLGVIAQLEGRLEDAADEYRSSLELKQRVGDLSGAAMIEMNLGEVELDRGNTEGVADLLGSCLTTFERTGFTVGTAYTQGLLGRCASMEGDHHAARELLEAASQVFLELGAEGYSADMDLLLLAALIEVDDREEARRVLALNRVRLERDVFDNPASARRRMDDAEERLAAI